MAQSIIEVLPMLFTADELARAKQIHDKHAGEASYSALVEELTCEITQPALPRINQKTNQENDARFFAYALIHLCNETKRR